MFDSQSIWKKTTLLPQQATLSGELHADVAVLGAGMAGILTAYFLQKSGLNVVVLEANRIASGQTGHTTAKISVQHGIIYASLIQSFGQESASQYAKANLQALQKYRDLIIQSDIDCAYRELPAHLYSSVAEEPLQREAMAAKSVGIEASFVKDVLLPFPVQGTVCFAKQAQFHPLLFLSALISELTIFENTSAFKVEPHTVFTNHGKVHAKHIVFATHYPFQNVPGWYFLRMHQERSYVLALKNAWLPQGMFLGIDSDGLSLREFDGMLLLGGGSHRTGENTAGGKYELLRSYASTLFPNSQEIAHWSAQDCITADGMPYIGTYAEAMPHCYVATGFAKWGMTGSMVAALLISGLILNQPPPWATLFSPQRSTLPASAKDLTMQAAQAVKGLARSFFTPPKAMLSALPNGHGGIVEVDGAKAGVYKDEHGQCHIVDPHCPHLHCQVEWNP
ncbi:MAG: FAD-dependent oxidoreductase, partial [Clostridia bacterium]